MNFLLRFFLVVSFFNYTFGFKNPSSVIFFPANFKNNLPHELYGNFISKISDKSNFHLSKDTTDENNKLIDEILDTDQELCLVSHLSGANQVINLCKKNNKIKNAVLINPINSKFFNFDFPYINPIKDVIDFNNLEKLENNVNEFLKNNDNLKNYNINITKKDLVEEDYSLERLTIINSKKNKKWNIFPSFYLMDYLNLDIDSLELKADNKEIIEIKDYNHFDILDKTWAKNLNVLLNGNPRLERYEDINKYHQDIADLIIKDTSLSYDVEVVND